MYPSPPEAQVASLTPALTYSHDRVLRDGSDGNLDVKIIQDFRLDEEYWNRIINLILCA